jgi:hypothetical protein
MANLKLIWTGPERNVCIFGDGDGDVNDGVVRASASVRDAPATALTVAPLGRNGMRSETQTGSIADQPMMNTTVYSSIVAMSVPMPLSRS